MVDRPYEQVEFPEPPPGRPWVFVNMVSTVDGKTVSGTRHQPVMDLGSPADHQAMRDLESHADAVLIGAETLRATPKLWYPARLRRFVATRNGDLPTESRFFTDAPEQAVVLAQQVVAAPVPGVAVWDLRSGGFEAALRRMRSELGIRVLAVEGGSELNASLFSADLVDELFVTVAPKLKLGRETPTLAGGEPLPRGALLRLQLLSVASVGDEVFLRYRRDTRSET